MIPHLNLVCNQRKDNGEVFVVVFKWIVEHMGYGQTFRAKQVSGFLPLLFTYV